MDQEANHKLWPDLPLADVIRPESKEAVDKLHEMGVEVAMLTGDSEDVARAVADEFGIDQYFAQVLPEHKDQKVMELQSQGKAGRDGRRRGK
jgi:P-type Cu2+ transporter